MEGRRSLTRTPRIRNSASNGAPNYIGKCRSAARYRRSYGTGLTPLEGQTPGIKLTSIRIPTDRELPKHRDLTEKVNPEQLSLLIKKEWRLSYVTPLYRFKHTHLKSYSRQLSAFIAAEKQKGTAVEVGPETGFKVTFSTVLGLTESDEDTEAVFIQIRSRPPFAQEGAPDVVVWSGWLACVNGNAEYIGSLPVDFTCLPLFCASGAESLTSLVQSWLRNSFDCNFGQLGISSSNLKWLAAMWTGCQPAVNIRYLKLSWTLPARPPLDVSYTIHPRDAWDLWSSIHQEKDRMSAEEVNLFMRCIESNFFRHFRVHLSAGELVKVSTAVGSAHRDGKIKFLNCDYMSSILALLTESALFMMPI